MAALAKEIWGEHYRGLLTPGQITYMVDRFQSEEAITLQLSEGYQYRLITVGDEPRVPLKAPLYIYLYIMYLNCS